MCWNATTEGVKHVRANAKAASEVRMFPSSAGFPVSTGGNLSQIKEGMRMFFGTVQYKC
jgi:hypothetical protein